MLLPLFLLIITNICMSLQMLLLRVLDTSKDLHCRCKRQLIKTPLINDPSTLLSPYSTSVRLMPVSNPIPAPCLENLCFSLTDLCVSSDQLKFLLCPHCLGDTWSEISTCTAHRISFKICLAMSLITNKISVGFWLNVLKKEKSDPILRNVCLFILIHTNLFKEEYMRTIKCII